METKVYRKDFGERMYCLPVKADIVKTSVLGEKSVTAVGIWDTGASNTLIAKHVVDKLGVEILPLPKGRTIRAIQRVDYYGIAYIALQIDDVRTPYFYAIVADLEPNDYPDFLIGMDVISQGRFELDSTGDETILTFEL